jgi:hypothetical protein
MPAATEWRSVESEPIPKDRWVLLWIERAGVANIGKRAVNGLSISGGFRAAVKSVSHWAEIAAPSGVAVTIATKGPRTTRDSQE